MIIDREDRAVFTHQLSNRRRGRPRAAVPTVPTTIRLPQPLFDACCRAALASGQSLPEVVREAVRHSVNADAGGHYSYSTNRPASSQW